MFLKKVSTENAHCCISVSPLAAS